MTILEIGAGAAVPAIRHISEQYLSDPDLPVSVVRINPDESQKYKFARHVDESNILELTDTSQESKDEIYQSHEVQSEFIHLKLGALDALQKIDEEIMNIFDAKEKI